MIYLKRGTGTLENWLSFTTRESRVMRYSLLTTFAVEL